VAVETPVIVLSYTKQGGVSLGHHHSIDSSKGMGQ